jgi:hypothetical protein
MSYHVIKMGKMIAQVIASAGEPIRVSYQANWKYEQENGYTDRSKGILFESFPNHNPKKQKTEDGT